MPAITSMVLVEGPSDRIALETLAVRLGRDLVAEGVSVAQMGGAASVGAFLDDLRGPEGFDVGLAGLCDQAQIGTFRRGLERAGFGSDLSPSEMEALGFFVCVADLEDELIRSLGVAKVEDTIEAQGELRSLRTLQNQPEWRGRDRVEQLRRFIGVRSGRKARYARLLVEGLDLAAVPRPLAGVLEHTRRLD